MLNFRDWMFCLLSVIIPPLSASEIEVDFYSTNGYVVDSVLWRVIFWRVILWLWAPVEVDGGG